MMAMSVSGSRIESGCSLRSTDRGMIDLHGGNMEFCSAFCNTAGHVILRVVMVS
jgi:hypothetical protein